MHATQALQFSEDALLEWLTLKGIRANLLVCARTFDVNHVVDWLVKRLPPPLSVGVLPGDLLMPASACGSWLLSDVAFLTAAQQRSLFDWLSAAGCGVQIISIASEPLWPLVASGRFLESLYYRLNTIHCDALPGDGGSAYDSGLGGRRL